MVNFELEKMKCSEGTCHAAEIVISQFIFCIFVLIVLFVTQGFNELQIVDLKSCFISPAAEEGKVSLPFLDEFKN